MNGKSENIVAYTAEEAKKLKGQTDWDMSHEEAMRRRYEDPEAPRPYPGWEKTIVPNIPDPKQQITLRLDSDMLEWFKKKGKGYQTHINAVLRGYYEHEAGK